MSGSFFFFGFVQYLSKTPSQSHLFFDRSRDSAITPLSLRSVKNPSHCGLLEPHLSATVWYCEFGRFSGCGSSSTGNGLPGWILVGSGSSIFTGGAGVDGRLGSDGVVDLRFLLKLTRAEARAGSFRFLSMLHPPFSTRCKGVVLYNSFRP